MERIKIIHEPTVEKPFLVLDKPKGLPSAPLKEDDFDNAFSQAAELFPQLLNVHGKKEIEHGLLHRLDTATDGLIVIAASQECYDFLSREQEEERFIKTYTAECDINTENADALGGFPPEQPDFTDSKIKAVSYFRPYGQGRKEVRPVTENSGKAALSKLGKAKLYTTEIEITKISEIKVRAICHISQGFRHQVRCHLAWAGFPVCGDTLYNANVRNMDEDKKNAEKLLFSASAISFEYPRGDLNSYDRKDTWT